MNRKFSYAIRILTTLGRSSEPMTTDELSGYVGDHPAVTGTLSSLMEMGYVSCDDTRRYRLTCDPQQLSLFDLKEVFGPYDWNVKQVIEEIIDEALHEITIGGLIKFGGTETTPDLS